MSFAASLKSHLAGDATLTALVGERIYPLIRPEGAAVSAVTYQTVITDDIASLGGRADSLRHVRVQIDCWARSYATALQMEAAIRSRMNTAASNFRAVQIPGGIEDYEDGTKLYRIMREFSCWFTES